MTATVSTGRPEDRAETDRIEALKCVTDEFAEKLTATAPAAPPPLTLDGLCGLIESLTTTVIYRARRARRHPAGARRGVALPARSRQRVRLPPDLPGEAVIVYRTGRHEHRCIRVQLGAEPSDADPLVGTMDTPELGRLVVELLNGPARGTPATGIPAAVAWIDVQYAQAQKAARDAAGIPFRGLEHCSAVARMVALGETRAHLAQVGMRCGVCGGQITPDGCERRCGA